MINTHKPVVGDQVYVDDINWKRRSHGPKLGAVTKVGSKLFSVERPIEGTAHVEVDVFRIDGWRANDAYGHRFCLTPEQLDDRTRRDAAKTKLVNGNLTPMFGHTLTTLQLEAMAAVLDADEATLAGWLRPAGS